MVVRACDVMNNVQLYSVFVASQCELALFGDDTPGVTRRCRLSWLTNWRPRISSPNAGGGGDCGVSANEQLCTSRDMEPK